MRYSETELSSARLDQPAFEGTPEKYFICTSPRSGSFMLCRYLINSGIAIPHEYFNPIHMARIAKRFEVADPKGKGFSAYIDRLVRHRTVNGLFAAKIQFWQYRQILQNEAGHKLLSGAKFIFLVREDMLAQAISYQLARITGKWGFDETVTTQPWRGDAYDVSLLDAQLKVLLTEEQGWRMFFSRNGIRPLFLTYEQMAQNPRAALQQVLSALGRSDLAINEEYDEQHERATPGPGIPSSLEIRDAYLKAKRFL